MENHNEYIISEHEKLPEDSLLIFLGDLHFGKSDEVDKMLSRIKCKKIYILGNHCHGSKLYHHFDLVCDNLTIDNNIYCCHYPPPGFNGKHNYNPHSYKLCIHGHDHKGFHRDGHVIGISYNGDKLIYSLDFLT